MRFWRKFRSWPLGAQIVAWVVLVVIVAAAIAGPPPEEDDEASPSTTTEARTESTDDPFATTTTGPTTTTVPTTTTAPPPTTLPPLRVLTFEERLDDDLTGGAFDVCKQFVERELTSPGSAEYPDFYDDDDEFVVAITRRGNYRLTSHVDSENGFGALLRSEYECTVHYEGDDQWTLVDLVII